MQQTLEPPLTGQLIDDSGELTLDELCMLCQVDQQHIVALIDEGVLQVGHAQTAEWRFATGSVRCVMTVLRLQRDLQVNLAGAALALELLQEIEELRRQLRLAKPGLRE